MHLLWPGGEGALESLLCAIWFSQPHQGPGTAAEMCPLFPWCQQCCPHGVSGASCAQMLVRAPGPSPPEPSSGSLSFLHLSAPSDVLCPFARRLTQKQLARLHPALQPAGAVGLRSRLPVRGAARGRGTVSCCPRTCCSQCFSLPRSWYIADPAVVIRGLHWAGAVVVPMSSPSQC